MASVDSRQDAAAPAGSAQSGDRVGRRGAESVGPHVHGFDHRQRGQLASFDTGRQRGRPAILFDGRTAIIG